MVVVTKQDIIDYANECGKEAAYGIVLLYGPDSFSSYDDYDELVNLFKS